MELSIGVFLVTEKEGTSGAVSICYRLTVMNPKLVGMLSYFNKTAAIAGAKVMVGPLVSTKEGVEKLLAEYDPNAGPGVPPPEVVYKGFDHNGEYDEGEHTDMDRAKKTEAEQLVHDWWMQRMNPKMGWEELLKEDKSRLDHGVSAFHVYDQATRIGKGMAHCFVNATPKQVFGWAADRRTRSSNIEYLNPTYTTSTGVLQIPIPVPLIDDRESVYRSVKFRNDQDNSYAQVDYTVEVAERPVEGGKVRIEALACIVVKEAPGSEGEKSECWRVSQYDLKLRKGLGFISNIVAAKTAELIAAPMEKLKLDVEQLLKEYKPPEHVVESLELTWKGGLWRMALEMALGVQYLHHHRYECQTRVCLRPIHPANSSAGTGAMAGSGTTGRPTRWRRSSRDGRSA
jgi:hypothetical protein